MQSRQTSKSKISNKYHIPFPKYNTLESVALAVALSVHCFIIMFVCFLFRVVSFYPDAWGWLRLSGPFEQRCRGSTLKMACFLSEMQYTMNLTRHIFYSRLDQ